MKILYQIWVFALRGGYYPMVFSITGQNFLQFADRGDFSILHLEAFALRGVSTV